MFFLFTKIFVTGKPGATVPDSWPSDLSTRINAAHPLDVTRPRLSAYMSSSPPSFCPAGREEDANAIIGIIDAAERFVRVAVMDYFPATIYGGNRTRFWPLIDNAIRRGEKEKIYTHMHSCLYCVKPVNLL
jgi:phospholipase D3/4